MSHVIVMLCIVCCCGNYVDVYHISVSNTYNIQQFLTIFDVLFCILCNITEFNNENDDNDDDDQTGLIVGVVLGVCASLLVGAGIVTYQRHRALNEEEDRMMLTSDSESLTGSKGKSDYTVFHSSHGSSSNGNDSGNDNGSGSGVSSQAQGKYQPVGEDFAAHVDL